MSSTLGESLERAHGFARDQGHRAVTLEHLLLAFTEDADASAVLQASNVDLVRLGTDVSGYLGRLLEDMRAENGAEPATDPELLRVLHAAVQAAQQSRRRQIDGAIVLAAVVGDGKSPAAGLLKSHGLTFEEVIRALQKTNAKANAQARSKQFATPAPTPPPTAPMENGSSSLEPAKRDVRACQRRGGSGRRTIGRGYPRCRPRAHSAAHDRHSWQVGGPLSATTACRSRAASAVKARHCPGANPPPFPEPDELIEEARSSPASPRPPTPPSPSTPLPPASQARPNWPPPASGACLRPRACLSPRRSGRRLHFRKDPCSRAKGPRVRHCRIAPGPAAACRPSQDCRTGPVRPGLTAMNLHHPLDRRWPMANWLSLLHPPREGQGSGPGDRPDRALL